MINKFFVELDGVSMIATAEEFIEKGDVINLLDDGEPSVYRVRGENNEVLNLRHVRTVKNKNEKTEFSYKTEGGEEHFFENRLSPNQTVYVDYTPYTVKKSRESGEMYLELLDSKIALALFGVYENRFDEGFTPHDREVGVYEAEKYTTSREEAIGYVMKERGKGRKVSL